MKYWQKVFLCTLALFVVAINLAAFVLADAANESAIDSERERIVNDWGFISNALCRDIEAAGNATAKDISDIFTTYKNYYRRQGVYLELSLGDVRVMSAPLSVSAEGEDISVSMYTSKEKPYLYAAGKCSGGVEVAVTRMIASTVERLDKLRRELVIMTALISAVLATALFMILKRLTLPIKRLSAVTYAFSSGELAVRASAAGRDELSELAQSFNAMADKIQTQMTALETDSLLKQRFIDDMAHELRTPLTAISGYSEYIAAAAATEDEKLSALMYIKRESTRLARLSNKLLLIAKLREGSAEKGAVDMKTLFLDVEYALADEAKARGVQLTSLPSAAIWLTDGELIYTIVQNLALNAIRACAAGGHVELAADENAITVSDDGRGMDSETLKHIIEPFYRADKARSREQGGTGLGLSICDGAARLLGLELRFESELGKGTRAIILQVDKKSETSL